MRATATMGTLIRKTAPNQKWPSNQPLMTGPKPPAARDAGPDGDGLGPLVRRNTLIKMTTLTA
jgi:hypothetical protein